MVQGNPYLIYEDEEQVLSSKEQFNEEDSLP